MQTEIHHPSRVGTQGLPEMRERTSRTSRYADYGRKQAPSWRQSMSTKKLTTRGGTGDTMLDIDASASLEQVPGVYQPSSKHDMLAGKDIDEGHGGINQTVQVTDGAASSTTMTMHSSSAPTPEDMGFM
jgi:hypothetical protein